MSHFKKDTLPYISLETENSNVSSAEVTKIKYRKPSGAFGDWDATVSGTKLIKNLVTDDIDETGWWKFQAYIEVGGQTQHGDIFSYEFLKTL